MTGQAQPQPTANAYLWVTAAISSLALVLAAVVTLAAPETDAARLFVSECLGVAKIGVGAFAVIRLGAGGQTPSGSPPLPPPK